MRHVLLSDCTSYQSEVDGLVPNKSAAPNPSIASRLPAGRHWRGVAEPGRSLPCFMLPRVIVLFLMMLGSVKGAEGVVLLHGLCRTSASMAKMEDALASEGYVVLNCDYPSRTQPIEELSLAVVGGALADER